MFAEIKALAIAATQPGMTIKKEYLDRLRKVVAIHNKYCLNDIATLDIPAGLDNK